MSTDIYISNKYSKLYFKIISNAQGRVNEGYTEKHHILPKSLGGTDHTDNIIELTAQEHYLCHYLLTKFTEGKNRRSMLFAFNAMNMKSRTNSERKFNSKLYEGFKKDFSNAISEQAKERWADPKLRKVQSDRSKEQWLDSEHKKNVSKKAKERWADPKFKKNMSEKLKEAYKIKVECEYCKTLIPKLSMKLHLKHCKSFNDK